MTLGILIIFAGYTIASYGVVLIRGYDITLKEWLDPLDPYQWPKGQVPKVPAGQIFPGGPGSGSSSKGSGGSSGKNPTNLPLTPPPPVVGP